MFELLVSLPEILEFIQKCRDVIERMEEANKQMDTAAQELCSTCAGEAVEAFAEEQKVLYGYCEELTSAGHQYTDAVQQACRNYEETEQEILNHIKG